EGQLLLALVLGVLQGEEGRVVKHWEPSPLRRDDHLLPRLRLDARVARFVRVRRLLGRELDLERVGRLDAHALAREHWHCAGQRRLADGGRVARPALADRPGVTRPVARRLPDGARVGGLADGPGVTRLIAGRLPDGTGVAGRLADDERLLLLELPQGREHQVAVLPGEDGAAVGPAAGGHLAGDEPG